MPKLIIFDSDGTLTPLRGSATGPFSFELLPGVVEKCAELRAQGHVLAIASNQSRRRSRGEVVQQLRWTQRTIGASTIRWAASARCKPSPAMLLEIAQQFNVQPADVLFVGDWETDKQAAESAGCGFAWSTEFFKGEEKCRRK